jgi:hypothetical protein
MWFTGVASAVACLHGHTAPQMPQKPPTLVCACFGGWVVADVIVGDVM